MKYKQKTVDLIIGMLSSDTYTIKEVCAAAGITKKTFYEWRATKKEFDEALKEVEAERMNFFVAEAKKSLLKKVRGYDVVETSETKFRNKNGEMITREKTEKTKHFQPDTAAIIFTLTNGDPEHWKNKQTNELEGSINVEKPRIVFRDTEEKENESED